MKMKIKMVWRKVRAILDIIETNKFYLITFKDDESVNWRTEYNIKIIDIQEKI